MISENAYRRDARAQERKSRRGWRTSPLVTMAPLVAVLCIASCAHHASGLFKVGVDWLST